MTTYTNQYGQPISEGAYHALQGAMRVKSIGLYSAIRYTMKRSTLSYVAALRLITLARQLMAMNKAEIADIAKDTQAAGLLNFTSH